MDTPTERRLLNPARFAVSVIVPTYNESGNIVKMLDSLTHSIPAGMSAEIIIVDDNSPDATSEVASLHARTLASNIDISVIRRPAKLGLSSAIVAGIDSSCGETIIVMDGDFSHPPNIIPHMIKELKTSKCDIVIASRYVDGGTIIGWPTRRMLMSKGATKIARYGLGIGVKDPMSGFFAFRRDVISGVRFEAIGYKMLLEMLVKLKGVRVKEIPYTFTNRTEGSSKVNASVVYDYVRAVLRLYRFGRSSSLGERRTSVRFLSKAARFYTVGASGLFVNYVSSFLLSVLVPNLWYLHATAIGILFSVTSNFFLNKLWTFEDPDFRIRKTAVQYALFLGFSSLGALLQIGLVYLLVENFAVSYPWALVLAVGAASVGNFLLNKRWTFREKIWS